jgi:hypothetical protein
MPRDGLQQYAPPPGTNGITNYTIESTKYNGFVADVTQDLNLPRPIVAGGTGANNAHDALINLHGEESGQVVTNYDSFPFVPGSFYSAAGATGAPTAQGFNGICYSTGNYMTLEGREVLGAGLGRSFVRQSHAGVWDAWVEQPSSIAGLDAAYVNVTGDTMTGGLTLTAGSVIQATAKGHLLGNASGNSSLALPVTLADANLQLYYNGPNNWAGIGADGGGNLWFKTGLSGAPMAAMTINATNQAVGIAGTAASTSPTTGALTVAGGVGVGGNLNAGTSGSGAEIKSGGALYSTGQIAGLYPNSFVMDVSAGAGRLMAFGPDPATYGVAQGWVLSSNASLVKTVWTMSSTAFNIPLTTASTSPTTGALTVAGGVGVGGNIQSVGVTSGGPILANGAGAGGSITAVTHFMTQGGLTYYNAAASAYIVFGTTFGFSHGVSVTGDLSASGFMHCGGDIQAGLGFNCRAGVGGGMSGNRFNIEYVSNAHLWINGADLGQLAFVSDYRVKKDVIDLPGMWDTVKALRPIKYTQAEFQPPSQKKYLAGEAARARKAVEDNPEAKPGEIDTGPLFAADDIERWGFIAHELQETLTPSASTGVKDDPVAIQSPNPWTVIATLTKALQEAMTRIEALEGGAARR